MTLEEAIKTAIEYEIKIRDLYFEGVEAIADEVGKRIFQMLGNDEQHHVDYLNQQLEQWQNTGRLASELLETTIPSKEMIARALAKVETQMAQDDRGLRQQLLGKALKMEIATSDFYRRMVNEMSDEGQALFARFLEIEDNHINTVQFELDYFSRSGYWFDLKEFDME